jgi:hypothetical protein
MKTIETVVYSFNELSKEAQKKAISDYVSDMDYPFLSDCMNERLHELLQENKIKDKNDTSKPGTKPTQVYFSLLYCQGDGAMFEGNFTWRKYNISIKQSGRYYHYNSKDIIMANQKHGDVSDESELYQKFNNLYVKICKELEQYGYDFIKNEQSEENVIETFEENDYTFTKDGIMKNY